MDKMSSADCHNLSLYTHPGTFRDVLSKGDWLYSVDPGILSSRGMFRARAKYSMIHAV